MSFTMYYDYHTKWGFHAYANSEDPDVKACISSQINQVLYSLQNEGLDSAEFTGKKWTQMCRLIRPFAVCKFCNTYHALGKLMIFFLFLSKK